MSGSVVSILPPPLNDGVLDQNGHFNLSWARWFTKLASQAATTNGLPLTGGTLTGPLILGADPTLPLGAATRQFVTNSEVLLTTGVTTNSNAAAGQIGEYISSTVLIGAGIPLASGTPTDITSLPLSGGDWDCWGVAQFDAGASPTVTALSGWINTATATIPTGGGAGAYASLVLPYPTNASQSFPVGFRRVSLAAAGHAYLSVSAGVTGTLNGFGFLAARRAR